MKKYYFIFILALAFILRFWKLGEYPALNADEAAVGYNAYSLLETGKDEHGISWPIHFQSFNDYKPGLYFYLVLPFVKYYGLNEWSVRIPGALLGVASVYLVYLLCKRLLENEKLALLSALMLAVSPWHIHFSRGGWEVNASTFFIILGVYLFLISAKNLSILMLSVVSFALAMYTYHAARVVVPLLGASFLFLYWRDVQRDFKKYFLAGIVGVVVVLPLIKDFTKPDVTSRAAGVGLFADTGPLSRINEQRGEHGDFTSTIPVVMHNKAVNYALAFAENWADHFHGEFLFLSGEQIQRNRVPEVGEFYMIGIILLLIGLWQIAKNPKGWSIIIIWLVTAPLAAALTFQSPHALRSQNMVVPLTVISAFGLMMIFDRLKSGRLKVFITFLIVFVLVYEFVRYQHEYWVHMAREYPFSSQYGVKELASYIKENGQKYDKIIVSDNYDQPYILLLFYLGYPPSDFQNEHVLSPRDKFGFSTVTNFNKYEFKKIDWDVDQPNNPNSLIIGTEEEIPKEANIVKKIYGTNGYLYFEAVEN